MAPLELKNVRVSTIKPLAKSDHVTVLHASIFDLNFVDAYIPTIHFYRSQRRSDAGALISKMKDSLRKVLVPFFPFAGCWVRTYDARIRELQCNDEGVPFIEASVDEEIDSVLNKGNFDLRPELGGFELLGLDPFVFHQDVDSPAPSVFVQATTFKCGGVTLNVSISHMTADGLGMATFMKAWSEIALNGETSIVPTHDRSLILPRETLLEYLAGETGKCPANDAENKGQRKGASNGASNGTSKGDAECNGASKPNANSNGKSKGDSEHCNSASRPNAESNGKIRETVHATVRSRETLHANGKSKADGCKSNGKAARMDPVGDAYRPRHVEPLIGKVLQVQRKAVEDLKCKAAEEKIGVTTVDLISAHLWQSVAKVIDTEVKPMSMFSTWIDGRKRFHDPPLPESFTGNAVLLTGTPQVPSKELSSSYSLFQAASTVHRTVRGSNTTTWKQSLLQTSKIVARPDLNPLSHLALSSWLRFSTYETSFGLGYGNPVFVCLNMSSDFFPHGIVFILPPPPSQSEESIAYVQFFLEEKNGFAEALYSNKHFLSFFHPLE